MILGIDHVGIACSDIQRSMQRYAELFDLELVKYEERPASGVLEAMLSSRAQESASPGGIRSYVQLLQPLRPGTALAQFLAEHGEGVQHVGYAVTRIAPMLAHLTDRGVRIVPDMPTHGIFGSSIAFLESSSMGGVLTELVEVGTR
jgi:methylmalonyl-CoA/ethylmalonyl-CoA epimerase